MIQEGATGDHSDTVDIIFQSVQVTKEVPTEDGKGTQYVQVVDDLSLWWKTLSVASNELGQLAFQAMEYLRVGKTASQHMCAERAAIHEAEVVGVFNSIRKSLDSKSSESIRNKDNSQGTLIDKVNKNSVEKIYTMKDTAKKSLWSSILGKEQDKMSDD